MEIIVEGKAEEYFTPDEAILNINFTTKGYSYEEVLREGIKNVQRFVEKIVLKNNFRKEEMKTRNFVIREDTKYNKVTGEYDPDGYSFNQTASLKFDYNKELIANMIILLSKLDNAPNCQISFGIKDENDCRKSLLASAYQDALKKARDIADAAGKKLKDCEKVDFKPFSTDFISQAMLSTRLFEEEDCYEATDNFMNTFTPEDIKLEESLYCLWIAE